MARTGQTLLNPVSGERITFRTTAEESNGELVAIELVLPRVPACTRPGSTSTRFRRSASR